MMRSARRGASRPKEQLSVPAGGETATSPSADALASIHARLLKDHSLQFEFRHVAEPKPSKPPGWLEAIFKFIGSIFEALTPLMTIVFWAGVAAIVGLV